MLGMYPYWYEVGIKLASVMDDHCNRVTKMMNDVLIERYLDIFTHAQNGRNEDVALVKTKYCQFEQQLYSGARGVSLQFEQWKDRPITKILPSELAHLDCEPVEMESENKKQKIH